MLPLGHMGISLGVVALVTRLTSRRGVYHTAATARAGASSSSNLGNPAAPGSRSSPVDWLLPTAKRVDFRILLLGSLLPDIVDKLLGVFAFSAFFSNSRIFAHTLLFILLLGMAGLYFYSRAGKTALLTLSWGAGLHLVFDSMWLDPQTLFWPLFGWEFRRIELGNWLWRMLMRLLTDPGSYIPEIIGAIIISILVVRLAQLRKVKQFLRAGRID